MSRSTRVAMRGFGNRSYIAIFQNLTANLPGSLDHHIDHAAGKIIGANHDNIYVPDGFGNARVAKLDGNGKFLKRGVRTAPFLPLRSRFLNLQKSVRRLSRRVNLTVN